MTIKKYSGWIPLHRDFSLKQGCYYTKEMSTLANCTVLKFIPLCSPARCSGRKSDAINFTEEESRLKKDMTCKAMEDTMNGKEYMGVIEGQPSSCAYANVSFNSSPSSTSSLSLHGDTTSPIYSSSLSNIIYSDTNSTTVTATLHPFQTCNSIDNLPFHPYYSQSQNITSYPYVPYMVYGCHLPAYKDYFGQEFQPKPYFFYPEKTV